MVIFHSYVSLPEGKIHWLTIVVAKTTTVFDNSWVSHIFGHTKIVMGTMMVSWSAWNGTWFPSLKQTYITWKTQQYPTHQPRRINGVKQQSIDDMSMLGTLGPKRSETNHLIPQSQGKHLASVFTKENQSCGKYCGTSVVNRGGDAGILAKTKIRRCHGLLSLLFHDWLYYYIIVNNKTEKIDDIRWHRVTKFSEDQLCQRFLGTCDTLLLTTDATKRYSLHFARECGSSKCKATIIWLWTEFSVHGWWSFIIQYV